MIYLSVEAFASEVISSQSSSSSEETITVIASSLINALAEIAISENIKVNYVVEYASAGISSRVDTSCSKAN